MIKSFLKISAGVFFTLASFSIQAQVSGIPAIEKAIFEKDFKKADALLQPIIKSFINKNKPDSLLNYLFFEGKVTQGKKDIQAGVKAFVSLREKIKSLTNDPGIIRQAYIEEGEFYGSNGMNHQGYEANIQAKKYVLLMPGRTENYQGLIENNLSTFAQRIGDIDLAGKHSRAAIKILTSVKNANPETLYIAYNGMGAMMWYASKSDSALYYYNKALETLDKAEPTPMNKYFRPSTIQNNLAGLYSIEGNTTKAIITLNLSLANLRNFITSSGADPKKQSAILF
ncbi:MAG: tetratricopeptide repeat protein, partial [Ginsengibacter sp.]